MKKKEVPNCYECTYRENLYGDAHSKCTNEKAKVTGILTGVRNGWFSHPNNYDPCWVKSCDGFERGGI